MATAFIFEHISFRFEGAIVVPLQLGNGKTEGKKDVGRRIQSNEPVRVYMGMQHYFSLPCKYLPSQQGY